MIDAARLRRLDLLDHLGRMPDDPGSHRRHIHELLLALLEEGEMPLVDIEVEPIGGPPARLRVVADVAVVRGRQIGVAQRQLGAPVPLRGLPQRVRRQHVPRADALHDPLRGERLALAQHAGRGQLDGVGLFVDPPHARRARLDRRKGVRHPLPAARRHPAVAQLADHLQRARPIGRDVERNRVRDVDEILVGGVNQANPALRARHVVAEQHVLAVEQVAHLARVLAELRHRI